MKAIILNKTRYGEADLILRLLTQEGEPLSAIAKSALRSRRRFGGGVLEPLNLVHFACERRGGDDRLPVLTEAQVIEDFQKLRTDYDRLEFGLHCAKTIATAAKDGEQCKELFDLIGHALQAAQVATDLQKLKLQFDVKLLFLQGVLPKEGEWQPYLVTSMHAGASARATIKDFPRVRAAVDYYFRDYFN